MTSTSNKKGDTLMGSEGAYFFNLSVGILLIIIVLMYLTFCHKQQNSDRLKVTNNGGVGNQLLLDENDEDIEDLDEEERAN